MEFHYTSNGEGVPKFWKSSSINLSLQSKVETEIDRLVMTNISVPLDNSKEFVEISK